MREIKFRGKRVDNGEWVVGYYAANSIGSFIIYRISEDEIITVDVIPETFGEYTGLKDKKGKEIYEGDIIRRYTGYIFETKVREYRLGEINQAKAHGYDWHESDEIIGNIHEHAHLLTSHPA